MSIFRSYEEKLRREVDTLREENLELTKQISALNLKLYESFGEEREKKLAEELELTSLQRSKLALIFSIERCRAVGVPEDQILHDKLEIDNFFSSEEST